METLSTADFKYYRDDLLKQYMDHLAVTHNTDYIL